MWFLAAAALAAPSLLLDVGGMDDDCCAQKVAVALEALPFIGTVAVSQAQGKACATLTGAVDEAALRARVVAAGYTVSALTPVESCPAGLVPARKDPWDGVTGLDAVVISRGEAVDLAAHAAPGKFTIYDFGAPWCAPCFTAADTLQTYLGGHADVGVRVVFLEQADALASFELPAAKQHLQFAAALPWFVVEDARGRSVYKGTDVAAAIAAIDKRRAK